MPEQNMLFAITGCSGGGKSTLVEALAGAGFAVVREPGRRIIAEGGPLPWDDPLGFARKASDTAMADLLEHQATDIPVFFDRGLLDAEVAIAHLTGAPLDTQRLARVPMADPVFLAPPWPDIFQTDADRRHGLSEAVAEYDRIAAALSGLGWRTATLPKASVENRVAFVLDHAELSGG